MSEDEVAEGGERVGKEAGEGEGVSEEREVVWGGGEEAAGEEVGEEVEGRKREGLGAEEDGGKLRGTKEGEEMRRNEGGDTGRRGDEVEAGGDEVNGGVGRVEGGKEEGG